MSLNTRLSKVLLAIAASGLVFSPLALSCEQSKSKVSPKIQTAKPKPQAMPKVRPLTRNPYRADGSTTGCKLVVTYDAYFKQPVYACPMPTKLHPDATRWLLADGSKYYKP